MSSGVVTSRLSSAGNILMAELKDVILDLHISSCISSISQGGVSKLHDLNVRKGCSHISQLSGTSGRTNSGSYSNSAD